MCGKVDFELSRCYQVWSLVSWTTAFLTSETSQPRIRKPVWCTEQLTVTGSPNLQREGSTDVKQQDRVGSVESQTPT